ncbi:tripartite tricarboxylate transporter substrate binding protein [Vineibacter terrae]|uniref:Bug family tripartite tricarboxylate transporter substrate binding protein n=1 Tax=Vineibacter terrae TaxID=2586908 RepID=UPI002E37D21D|nr:tripartite tricarboxylate transporter substrate binding protein [Vineibacter terrae]HEX2889707.1 tripartite tricarboxylate transporter substrate binding protein [Vineibacter terrae]
MLALARPLVGLALTAITLQAATAQQPAFSDRPIRMNYGFAAGGSGDMAARLLADVATKVLGQRVVVENRTGANGMIAAEATARSPADGHTVLFCTTGNMTIITELPGVQLPVNPATDLMGIGQLLRSTFGLVVGKESPYRSVQDLVAAARANPGKISYATPGVGSVQHLSNEILSQKLNIKMVHVPYRGSQAALHDLVSGRVDFSLTNLGDIISHVRSGSLRLLALGDPLGKRFFPDAPMISDVAPGFETYAWFGLCGPTGMPAAVVKRWEEAIKAAVEDPAVSEKLLNNGMVPAFTDAAALAQTMEKNRRDYREVIRAANIRVD